MGLFVSNAPVAKFAKIGDSVEGVIVDIYKAQRYEYVRGGQGEPLYWSNRKPTAGARIDRETGKPNDPVLQTVITVDTDTPDANGDTERRIFIKNKRMEHALTTAVTLAGGRRIGGLLLGGFLRCTWVGEEQGDGPSPAKVYDFGYTAPAAGTGREPSGEVRLAEREDEPAAPTYRDRLAVGDPVPSLGIQVPAGVAASSARAGIKDTDVTRGAQLINDEPPF